MVKHHSESRRPVFDLHSGRRVVSLARHINFSEYWLISRRRWLRLDMTEKVLTVTLKLNANKQI